MFVIFLKDNTLLLELSILLALVLPLHLLFQSPTLEYSLLSFYSPCASVSCLPKACWREFYKQND